MRDTDADLLWSLRDMGDDAPLDPSLDLPLGLDEEPGSGAPAHLEGAPVGSLADHGFEIEEEEAPFSAMALAEDPAFPALLPPQGFEAEHPIPRIRIHAACAREEVMRTLAAAAADRRLARTDFAVKGGGLEAAIGHFAAHPSPDLLILDTAAAPGLLLQELERLADVLDGSCKVMVIGAANDIVLYRKLMRMGVSEYLVAPLEPLQVIRSIGALYADPEKPFAGRVTAVMGARGGVGASTLAHNIAWLIAEEQGVNTTLVDLDLSFGTAALDFNEDAPQSIADALEAGDRVDAVFLDRIVTRPTERLQLFTAPARLERALALEPDSVASVLDKVRRTSPHIILDLPHVWSAWMHQTLVSADDLLIVAAPDLASLRNAKHLCEALMRARPNDAPPRLVLNTLATPRRPEIPTKDFAEHVGATVIAEIPFDPAAFGAAANNGQMLHQAAPGSRAAHLLGELALRVSGREPISKKPPSLLSRLGLQRR
jgi:pilus assembly protein CpaE